MSNYLPENLNPILYNFTTATTSYLLICKQFCENPCKYSACYTIKGAKQD